ncbi:MAG: phosphate regulon sensor histidine kinase PhoR [Gammaproteobacteria bacterium]
MKEDFWRFSGVIILSALAGTVTGQVTACLLAGVVLFVFWQYRTLRRLLLWLQRRGENDPPETPGIIDEICREIDSMRVRHKKRKAKLSGFLNRFQDSTAALPDAIVILGMGSEIEWANNKAQDYLGVNWPQDARQRISNLIRHPELMNYIGNESRYNSGQSLQLSSPVNNGLELELRVVPYGKKQKLLVARDITKIHRINRMRKDFIANASHELRTPLTVIAGYLEGLDSEECPPGWRPQIEQMRRQTERMQRLIEDLLMLSSLESDVAQQEKEVVAVPEMLSTIYQEAQSLSGIMGHIFYLETDADLRVKGYQRELYSAFSNLVFNAVQHTPEKGIIRIKWYREGNNACLEVIDTGAGIGAEHIPRLTERFYRVDKGRSRDKGGTGLGLAIVKHALVRHGASLQIHSQPGKGSTFRCEFPELLIITKPVEDAASLPA